MSTLHRTRPNDVNDQLHGLALLRYNARGGLTSKANIIELLSLTWGCIPGGEVGFITIPTQRLGLVRVDITPAFRAWLRSAPRSTGKMPVFHRLRGTRRVGRWLTEYLVRRLHASLTPAKSDW